jgi:cell division septation protein DedD
MFAPALFFCYCRNMELFGKKRGNPVLLPFVLAAAAMMILLIVIAGLGGSPKRLPAQTLGTSSRSLKYFGVDRATPINDANFKLISERGVNTVVALTDIRSSAQWKTLVTLSEKYNFNIVIFPDQGGDVPGCGWETPFNSPVVSEAYPNGYFIDRVKPMMDYFDNVNNWPGKNIRVIGMVTTHEPDNTIGTCKTSIANLADIKSQLKAYVNRSDFKVWGYTGGISNIKEIPDYAGTADIERVADVVVGWNHCFAENPLHRPEGTCSQALAEITRDRGAITAAGLEGKVELVFLFQTFAQHHMNPDGTPDGYRMPTYDEMLKYSQDFLNTGALDGFVYYTWGACWYTSDLYCQPGSAPGATNQNKSLWPIINYIHDVYVVGLTVTPPATTPGTTIAPTPTRIPTTGPTPVPTNKPTPIPTRIPTNVPTKLPTPKPTVTKTPTKAPTRIPTKWPTPTPIVFQTPSTLSFVTPANGTSVKIGTPTTFEVAVPPTLALKQVDFYVSFWKICSDTTAPYQCDYNFPIRFPWKYKITAQGIGWDGKTYSATSWVSSIR